MKKLSKADSEQQDSLVRSLNEKADAVREIVEQINALIHDELNPAISEYNGIITDADEFRNEIVGRMEDYVSERSEKWAEGEAGEKYESWKSEWEGLDLTEIESMDDIEVAGIGGEGEASDVARELESVNSGPEED